MGRVKELPIACTLTPSAMADRVEWLRRLGATSLLAGERRDGALHLCFRAGRRDGRPCLGAGRAGVLRLPSFELDRDPRELRLAVAGPKGSEPVLDGPLAALRGETS